MGVDISSVLSRSGTYSHMQLRRVRERIREKGGGEISYTYLSNLTTSRASPLITAAVL